jgi:hypothetical protein
VRGHVSPLEIDIAMKKRTCSLKSCSRPVHALGLCRTHYDRQKKGGVPPGPAKAAATPKCSVPGCSRPDYAQNLCQMHYEARRKGIPGPRSSSTSSRNCSVPGCTAAHHAKGYCKSHYGRLLRRKGGGADGEAARYTGLCEIAGCNRAAAKNKRCEEHQDVASGDGKRILTRAERLLEIHKRHDRMRKEIEHIKESLAKEREDD